MATEDGLKAQKLLAQGSALGFRTNTKSRPERQKLSISKLLPFQATLLFANITQGATLG
mgnify:CR=1 FL=1